MRRFYLPAFFVVVGLTAALGAQNAPAAQEPVPAAGTLSAEQLQQLVAPVALYPDPLVAQILAASTFPTQIVEADRWLQQNRNLKDAALGDAVNQQDWDSSVKALCEYSTVLSMMDTNLTWTSNLGDAYYNQPDDVMAAIQTMRRLAMNAGTLKSTSQQTVSVASDGTIDIEPAAQDAVYVPEYNPWLCYGGFFGQGYAPWYPWAFPSGWYVGFGIGFGPMLHLGFWGRYPWAMPVWGFDWHGHNILYGHAPYRARGPVFMNHFIVHPAARGTVGPGRARGGEALRPAPGRTEAPRAMPREAPNRQVNRGFQPPPNRPAAGTRSSAFSGFNRGGVSAGNAAHGMRSMGGGAPHGRGR